MALRVLLADESQTIKKVIQLALQDFSVEVKPVHSGIDVLPIAKVFQPDIIFADVLLAKKTGYDVCKELKNNPETASIPIVLMWNSLMGIDEKKALESKADRRLEKPFEVETLRQIIQELAPKTVTNPISSFLNFGEIESFKDLNKVVPTAPPVQIQTRKEESQASYENLPDFFVKPPVAAKETPDFLDKTQAPSDVFELDTEEDDFAQVQLTPNISLPESDLPYGETEEKDTDDWSQQKIDNIQSTSIKELNINYEPQETLNLNNLKSDGPKKVYDEFLSEHQDELALPEENDLKNAKVKVTENFEEIIFNDEIEPTGLPKAPALHKPPAVDKKPVGHRLPPIDPSPMSSQEQENIFREEARAIIEKICWTLLPDIAERVVREEIKKLLQDAEKSI